MTNAPDTLEAARQWLREHLDDGAHCPCCTQYARVYRRKLTSASVRALIALYREGQAGEWLHLPSIVKLRLRDVAHQGGYMTLAGYWGLMEEERSVIRDDGGRAGWWRITTDGEEWVRNRSTVPKYARIYDARLLGLTGEPVTILDALGAKFDYHELMQGI